MNSALNWVLKTFINNYVEDSSLYGDNLQIGLISGKFIFDDLHIKASLFSDFNLALSVTNVSIGRLRIELPWTNLGYEPIVLALEDVIIHAKANLDPMSQSESNDQLYNSKQSEIGKLCRKVCPDDTSSCSGGGGVRKGRSKGTGGNNYMTYIFNWFKSSLNSIIETIQLDIQNIHIRYEDDFAGEEGCAIGVMLSSLSIDSKHTSTSSSKDSHLSINKDVNLRQLSLYVSPSQSGAHLTSGSVQGLRSWMLYNVKHPGEALRRHYMLKPMDANVAVNCSIDTRYSKVNVSPSHLSTPHLFTNQPLCYVLGHRECVHIRYCLTSP